MEDNKTIPQNINERLLHFQTEVKQYFSFLNDYGYILSKIEIGQKENFLNYYCNFSFLNGKTFISIDYSTDIIKGQTLAFPQVKQRPVFDNLISCSISKDDAYMSVGQFIEISQSQMTVNDFSIPIDSKNIFDDITKVVRNYSSFFQNNLADVLLKKKMYNCYTDRFYKKIFEEVS